MRILITGGAGFIGSAVVRYIINHSNDNVVVLDSLNHINNTYSLSSVAKNPRYHLVHINICEELILDEIFQYYKPDAVMHLAAETHVDKSINNPTPFIYTNIFGTYCLLKSSYNYWKTLNNKNKNIFRFHHISTDEVYGDLGNKNKQFTETSSYLPNNPYSASKASSDHLVKSWYHTYGLPILITNSSNNYGPYNFSKKFIPLMILNAINGNPLTIYGSGNQIRDWIYVEDHARALYLVLKKANIGSVYNIGGNNEKKNIDVVNKICELLEELYPNKPFGISKYNKLITYIPDRPGHDIRYSIDCSKIKQELGWQPQENYESGIRKTIKWYIKYKDYFKNFSKLLTY